MVLVVLAGGRMATLEIRKCDWGFDDDDGAITTPPPPQLNDSSTSTKLCILFRVFRRFELLFELTLQLHNYIQLLYNKTK